MEASCGPGARQRRAGLSDLLGALCALSGGGEPEAELRRLLAAALRLCRAQSGLLILRPPGPPLLLAGSGKPPGPEAAERLGAVLGERFRGKLAVWKEAGFEPFWPGQPVKNFLSAPVRSGWADYGLLGLANKRGGFSARDLELAAQVASCAAACLASAEQRARAERALTQLEVLGRLGRDLLAELRLEPVLAAAKRLTGAELGMLAIFDSEARLIQSFGDGSEKCRVDSRLRRPRFLAKYPSASPVIANGLSPSSHLPQGHLPVTSALSVALPVGPQHSGCLMLANKPGGFSRQDGCLLETLAPCALLALLAEEGSRLGATGAESWAHREALRDLGHELKTPLSALALCHDLLASGRLGPLRPRQQHALQSARGSLERLRAACTRLVDLACLRRWRSPSLRQVDLAEVAREAVAAIEPLAAQQGLALEAEVPGSLPIQGDAERLRQLLDNLLSNAIKYTRPGGRVRLRAFAGAGAVRVEVADTGLGIGQGERERIFDRFFRGSSARHSGAQGHGLGLSIVREIVEMHGGSLDLESSPGAGTTFSVALPAAPPSGQSG